MTIKTKITLFIVGAGFVSSLLFSIVIFIELIEQPFDLLDAVLKEEAYRTVRLIVKAPKETDFGFLDHLSQELDQYWIEIYDNDTHKILFRSGLAKRIRLAPVKSGDRAIAHPEVILESQPDKRQTAPFRIRTFSVDLYGRKFVVQIARPMKELNEEIWELVFGILAGLIFSTIALTAISHFVAGKILQPVGHIKDLAKTISEKNLDQRIPTGDGQDEFNELSITINRMLDRLQYSFVRQRDFLFDTSHELKTPLTTMRLAVDEICASDLETLPTFIRDNLFRLNNQVLRMDRLVKDLLNLSALETLSGIDWKTVQITKLLLSLADEYRFLAGAKNITMDLNLCNPFVIQGDAEKLNRAFSNILDNALKYNVEGGRIELLANQTDTEQSVTVINTGPGIAETEIPKVFDQFYRGEKSRSVAHGGSGLGLAIVKKIIDLHGGKIDFESRLGGLTRVTVRLPRHEDKMLPIRSA